MIEVIIQSHCSHAFGAKGPKEGPISCDRNIERNVYLKKKKDIDDKERYQMIASNCRLLCTASCVKRISFDVTFFFRLDQTDMQ